MSRVLTCLVIVGLTSSPARAQEISGGIVSLGGPAQLPRDTRPAAGRTVIRGHVVAADGGQPLRRATVRVSGPALKGVRTTLTDASGRYEFSDLPAGQYSINASKPSFVNAAYGQIGKPLVLANNQTADGIDIRLPRGAVITGRVTDEFGEPVPNAAIMPLRQQFVQGRRRLMPAGSQAQTDDIGEYRIFGLAPGQYYVSAAAMQQIFGGPNDAIEGPETRNGYALTFYPGAPDQDAAQRLTVGAAQTLSGIDISLLATRLSTVSGFAMDLQGRPLTAGDVSAFRRGGNITRFGAGGPIRPDGTFTISGLAAGEYAVRATLPPAPGTAPGPPQWALAMVTVNGDDLAGVRLAPIAPATVSGRVSFDDAASAQALKPSAMSVVMQPLNPDDALLGIGTTPGPSPLRDDFTFELKTTPGPVGLRIVAQAAGGATPWQLKTIRVNGVDVTDTGIDVGSQGVNGIEIEMTNRLQQLSGTVADARGVTATDYAVAIFSQDRTRWTAPLNRHLAVGRPSNDGTFRISTLPPGDYYAIALDRIDGSEALDPESLEGMARLATTFSLSAGDTRTLDLKLVTLQGR